MAKHTAPQQGGSYVRNKDGSLSKVADTRIAKPAVAKAAPQPIVPDQTSAPAEPVKKGK